MKWIFVFLALVLVIGCVGKGISSEEEIEPTSDISEDELGPEDYTEVDELDEGAIDSEEELGSGFEDEEIF